MCPFKKGCLTGSFPSRRLQVNISPAIGEQLAECAQASREDVVKGEKFIFLY